MCIIRCIGLVFLSLVRQKVTSTWLTSSEIVVEGGSRGERGPIGPAGRIGPSGSKGDVGKEGACGPKGFRGDQGVAGSKGDCGSPKPRGFPGTITDLCTWMPHTVLKNLHEKEED